MPQDSLLNQRLDEYQIERLLGKGGMARVYQGLDVNLQRKVAIKVIDTPYRAASDYLVRFKREAQAIAQLEHPNIVRLYRYGEWDGLLYMAMQFVEGADLHAVLWSYQASGDFVEPKYVSQIVWDICVALDYCHKNGVIHRDIKPSNIMINAENRAILTDFGLALLTDVGTRGEIFGSPNYIAPEQAISSAKAVPQSDLYAVGVILYEIFTGQLPFYSEDPLELAMLHVSELPPPPRELRTDISAELEAVILKAMAKEPADRYQTGGALADALDDALRVMVDEQIELSPTVAIPSSLPGVQNKDGVSTLPLTPAVVSASPSDKGQDPPVVEPSTSSPLSKPSLSWLSVVLGAGALWAVLVVVMLCGLLVSPRIISNYISEKRTATSPPAVVETLIFPSPTMELGKAALPSPTEGVGGTKLTTKEVIETVALPSPTKAALTATPAPDEVIYMLLIKTRKDESLVIVNRSDISFSLPALYLEGENDVVLSGVEWEVENLQPGECVYAVKDKGKTKLPKIECQEVGEPLPREGRERFWKEEFDIYFNGKKVDTCQGEDSENGCWIFIDDD
jgi:serine/threonine protein kinase